MVSLFWILSWKIYHEGYTMKDRLADFWWYLCLCVVTQRMRNSFSWPQLKPIAFYQFILGISFVVQKHVWHRPSFRDIPEILHSKWLEEISGTFVTSFLKSISWKQSLKLKRWRGKKKRKEKGKKERMWLLLMVLWYLNIFFCFCFGEWTWSSLLIIINGQ